MSIPQRPLLILAALALAAASFGLPGSAAAEVEKYAIDAAGGHASINFRIRHLNFGWVYGRFNTFSGTFTYDTEAAKNSSIELLIQTASVDSNQAERDKHLRNKDFLNVDKFPTATFKSTAYKEGLGSSELAGDLTLNGITKPISFQVEQLGNGPDPWGKYRRAFLGTAAIPLKEFGISDFGPTARNVELTFVIEGVRQ
ncbi:YceI family protein [uncultured Thiodictyon sp.]|uniref:YceI family protein n=1 Tax=uncultured Thiodictyon sp. TaxID=1846217 RepID=UPI0025FE3556|nr:YceI family protein [uncultured Thiodictyon sp.]